MAGMSVRFLIIILSATLLHPALSGAHEYWVEPTTHVATPGDTIAANLNVGQDYSGTTYPYLADRLVRFWVTNRAGEQDIKGFTGDVPAATLRDLPEGLQIISYASTTDMLAYKKWERFTSYVTYEGNEWAIAAHKAAGLPLTGFSEGYRRYAKALVQVGAPQPDRDIDQAVGLPLELVAQGSPYVLGPGQSALEVQLLWQGASLADRRINIFRRFDLAEPAALTMVTTDAKGRAMIPVTEAGRYLLSAVRIELAPEDAAQTWDSYWASLTFEIEGAE